MSSSSWRVIFIESTRYILTRLKIFFDISLGNFYNKNYRDIKMIFTESRYYFFKKLATLENTLLYERNEWNENTFQTFETGQMNKFKNFWNEIKSLSREWEKDQCTTSNYAINNFNESVRGNFVWTWTPALRCSFSSFHPVKIIHIPLSFAQIYNGIKTRYLVE